MNMIEKTMIKEKLIEYFIFCTPAHWYMKNPLDWEDGKIKKFNDKH